MAERRRDPAKLRERLLYFLLVPAIGLAVLLLGAAALRTTLQIEKARQQTVFDATWALATERVKRLDEMIIDQDNAVDAAVDVRKLRTVADRWLLTAGRETPTVRAVLVLDAESEALEVRAFVSRRPGPEDDRFRRLLVHRLVSEMKLDEAPREQLRHLHQDVDGQSYLLSYWQRQQGGRRYLVVAWHYVDKLVAEIMPQIYRDLDGSSRMNVVDSQGRIVFGQPLQTASLAVNLNFPTTLYNWRVNVALTSAEGLEQRAIRQRYVQLAVVGLAMLIAVVGVVIVIRASISERRLATLKSDFVANVSHELKTPLASVRMFGEMLLTGRVRNDDKRREYLQIIVGESERLTSLIDNVLDFAKVERGMEAYSFAEADLAEVVTRAVESQRYRAGRADIELRVVAEGPIPGRFDSRAIELAVVNLLDNAFKYAQDTPYVEVQVAQRERQVEVVVVDEGPGLDDTDVERIFERFERGRGGDVSKVRGSGIGLALVQHIARAHGGDAEVESPWTESGRGARFRMRLSRDAS